MTELQKTFDEIGNLDENSKYRVQTFRVIMDKILEAVDSRFINNCSTSLLISLSLLSPGQKYFENLEERIKKYENNLDTIIKISGVDKIKVLDELRSFASCYSKLISTLNLKSHANLKQLDEDINNDYETGCVFYYIF